MAALVVIYQLFIWVDFCCVRDYICNGGKGKEKDAPSAPKGGTNGGDCG